MSDLHEAMAARVRANLRAIRTKQKVSQGQLARRIGTTHTYICQLETGFRSPSLEMVAKLASALGVDPVRLLKEV